MRSKAPVKHWAAVEESGVYWAMNLLVIVYRVIGRRLAGFLLYPIAGYFFIINGSARKASTHYLNQLNRFDPKAIEPTRFTSFRHFLYFSESLLDKLASWVGDIKIEQFDFQNRAEFLQLFESGQGAVLLAAHLGNLEVCRAFVELRPQVKLNILVHTKHADQFNRLMSRFNKHSRTELFQVSEITPKVAMLLADRIKLGELIVIVGDRIPVSSQNRLVTANFLGREANFSQGPYILASLLDCPVYTFFCVKEGDIHRIYFDHFADKIKVGRQQRAKDLAQYAQKFATILENYCCKTPLQWFNFFNFWEQGKTTEKHLRETNS